MESTSPRSAHNATRVRLSGRLDTLTTRKTSGGYSLVGSLRLDTPFRGVSSMALQLPIDSALLAGDEAILEGVLLAEENEAWTFDCSKAAALG